MRLSDTRFSVIFSVVMFALGCGCLYIGNGNIKGYIWGSLYNAKELSSLVYKAYARYCSISPCVGEDSHQLIAKSFCEKVPFYASLHKGDFRRPYEIVEGVYVDGNLSVDRALLKARKAIMDLGLNPYDFKYKYESQNMSLSGLISPFSI